jgi:hypothetical protein
VQDGAGNARGVVAHALQVSDDAEGGHHGPEIPGRRLLAGDQRQARFFDLEALSVDGSVPFIDPARQLHVPSLQGSNGPVDSSVYPSTDGHQGSVEALQISIQTRPRLTHHAITSRRA